jgi:hypothetical protein
MVSSPVNKSLRLNAYIGVLEPLSLVVSKRKSDQIPYLGKSGNRGVLKV